MPMPGPHLILLPGPGLKIVGMPEHLSPWEKREWLLREQLKRQRELFSARKRAADTTPGQPSHEPEGQRDAS